MRVTGTTASIHSEGTSGARGIVNVNNLVVVTARRPNENLQSVPVSVSVISGDQTARASVQDMADLQFLVPSLQATANSGSADRMLLQMRGLKATDVVGTQDPSVIPYIAEVPQMRPNGLQQLTVLDIGSVQALRGPQGTLFFKAG